MMNLSDDVRRALAIVFFGVGIFLLALLALSEWGCASSSLNARAEARGAVLATAEAVRAVDATCAEYARSHRDLALAQRCSRSYDTARLALVVTASAVDEWDRSGQAQDTVACAVRRAAGELGSVVSDLAGLGVEVPVVAKDALALVALLPACTVPEATAPPMDAGPRDADAGDGARPTDAAPEGGP